MNGVSPSIVTSSTGTASVFNTNALTGNLFGAATTIAIGASTGTITLGNQTLTGTNLATFNMNGTSPFTIATSKASSTANIFDSNVLTGNLFGAATTIAIGASSGTLTIGNATITGTNATAFNMNGASPNIVTSSNGTATVFNTNALTGNLFGAATTIAIGASTGTLTIGNATITGTNASTFNMNGTNPSIVTSDTGTASVFNTNALTGNLFGAATTITIGAITGTLNLRNVTITAANATTFNMNGANPSIVTSNTGTANVFNTNALTGNLFGAATTTNISNSGNINLGTSTSATTTVKIGGAISGNTLKIASTTSGTITVSSDVTTGTINLFTGITTGTMNIGSAANGIVDVAFTTESTSTTTGALTVAGGVGIGNKLYVNNGIYGETLALTNQLQVMTDGTDGNAILLGNYGAHIYIDEYQLEIATAYGQNLTLGIGYGKYITVYDPSGDVNINTTTESTSTVTGAFTVDGGVGIQKNLNVGGSTTMVYQTTEPTESDGVTVYAKEDDLSNTGLYYVNSSGTSGELVSKKKALAYSIVFG
jgi:hypothetical protein